MNAIIMERMAGILGVLHAKWSAGSGLSDATKGRERELIISELLRTAFPQTLSFVTGDVTDVFGRRSGQVDILVEVATLLSLSVGDPQVRLCFAERVALAIEVKSDLPRQRGAVVETAKQVGAITPMFYSREDLLGEVETVPIPVVAVGFRGWQKAESLTEFVTTSRIAGALTIDPPTFVRGPPFSPLSASGPAALWCFLATVEEAARKLPQTHRGLVPYGVNAE